MIRAVLDTNVIVSGTIVPHGNPAKVLKAWRQGRFVMVTSPAIIEEATEVLAPAHIARHYPLSTEEINSLGKLLATGSMLVPGTKKVTVVKEDPDDDLFVAVALEGEAEYIVSGDPHLLQVKEVHGVQVVTPREFLIHLKLEERF